MQKQAQKPDYKVQIYLNVLKVKYYEDKRNIWMQLLLNISNKVCVNKRRSLSEIALFNTNKD